MPHLPPGGSVPVPNALFDELLPRLSDPELRLLLVVVRATLGWREADGRGGWRYRRRDWLTNRLLARRTGCSSAAVSRAVQSLLAAGLIRVESAEGEVLATPGARRRNMGRLYFGLGDMWTTPPRRDNGAAGTTTDRQDKYRDLAARPAPDARSAPARDRTGPVRAGDLLPDRPRPGA